MHNLITRAERYCKQHKIILPESTIIVGLSGGPDSVFLLHALHALAPTYNLTLIAAHLDHGWRENSHLDVLFCKELAGKLGIQFISAHASQITLDREPNGSQEELGRLLRRRFFEQVALAPFDVAPDFAKASTGTQGERRVHRSASATLNQVTNTNHQWSPEAAPLVALAHHQDDQIETFFLRLIRGSGLAGLAAMRPRAGIYIRPLLEVSKQEVCAYLDEHKIPYLIDYTNLHNTYLRNRIRKQVIPALISTDPRFSKSCIRTIEHLQEADAFLEKLTQETFENISNTSDGHYTIDLKKFRVLEPFIQHRVVLHWLCTAKVPFTPTEAFFDEIIKFLARPTGSTHQLHPTWSIAKQKQQALIKKN